MHESAWPKRWYTSVEMKVRYPLVFVNYSRLYTVTDVGIHYLGDIGNAILAEAIDTVSAKNRECGILSGTNIATR